VYMEEKIEKSMRQILEKLDDSLESFDPLTATKMEDISPEKRPAFSECDRPLYVDPLPESGE